MNANCAVQLALLDAKFDDCRHALQYARINTELDPLKGTLRA